MSELLKTYKTIEIKGTTDIHGLSTKIINSIIDVIAPHLTLTFNKCIDYGVFPDLMKLSKVIPLFKAGSTTDPTNFRPISILPTLSKIFEKLILNQLQAHFGINKLMSTQQFGFTKGRSTTDAGVDLVQHIFQAWEESHDAIGIFCDLSKAFDCVKHDILIEKLAHYGITGTASSLLESYLIGRVQKIYVNGVTSSGSPVNIGVPQGSILGPFLFLVYINDLPKSANLPGEDIVLFADDTSLIFKVKRGGQQNCDEVNSAISDVVNWFTANNLLLNENKTKIMKFTLPNVCSLMSYGILLWGHAADRDRIFLLQKRAVRAIYIMRTRESLREKFCYIGILTFSSQYIYENLVYFRKNINK